MMIFKAAISSSSLLPKSWTVRRHFWCGKSSDEARKRFSVVRPGKVSPQLAGSSLPAHVSPPSYYLTGQPTPGPRQPTANTLQEVQRMRAACSLARRILNEASRLATPGVTTDNIDLLVTELAFEAGAYPSPLNYRHFPKPLEDGDILNIDVTVYLDGVHGDCSDTFLVGDVDEAGQTLVQVTREALRVGIDQCGPGEKFSSIGGAIQEYVERKGLTVVPAFTGHGIGSYFHGPPDIFSCRNSYPGTMRPGMTFTVEPIVSEGSSKVVILSDDWTAVSPDHSRSAQAEHTVLITEEGTEILTR